MLHNTETEFKRLQADTDIHNTHNTRTNVQTADWHNKRHTHTHPHAHYTYTHPQSTLIHNTYCFSLLGLLDHDSKRFPNNMSHLYIIKCESDHRNREAAGYPVVSPCIDWIRTVEEWRLLEKSSRSSHSLKLYVFKIFLFNCLDKISAFLLELELWH